MCLQKTKNKCAYRLFYSLLVITVQDKIKSTLPNKYERPKNLYKYLFVLKLLLFQGTQNLTNNYVRVLPNLSGLKHAVCGWHAFFWLVGWCKAIAIMLLWIWGMHLVMELSQTSRAGERWKELTSLFFKRGRKYRQFDQTAATANIQLAPHFSLFLLSFVSLVAIQPSNTR